MLPEPERIVWLNGDFLPANAAQVSIFDRGLLFSDAVYEGMGILDGRMVDFAVHMARLRRSLGELSIPEPMDEAGFRSALDRLIAENGVAEGFLYLHITRGVADRDYLPPEGMTPTVFAFTQAHPVPLADRPPVPVALTSHPDLRWARRDIKTSNLLGQVLAKQAAAQAGSDEALMIDADGFVTEGGCTSFFIVAGRSIIARPVTNDILNGVTRRTMLAVAEREGYTIEHRRITLTEALAADEAFVTGASSYIEPVARIDGQRIGAGEAPGPVTRHLRDEYLQQVRAGA